MNEFLASYIETMPKQTKKGNLMTKKTFIALAAAIRDTKPPSMLEDGIGLNTKMQRESRQNQWREMRDRLADFCQSQNAQFDRERFLAACGVTK